MNKSASIGNVLGLARIHILGASGSGTTTLGRALAAKLGCPHFDSDDFYWMPTEPPYRQPRPREEGQRLLGEALATSASWVLSGSLCGWGDPFIVLFLETAGTPRDVLY
jgi:adenylate kinase family enzyme